MNPLERLPKTARAVIYMLWILGGPILIYTEARGWTGKNEYALWMGLGSAAGITAISNMGSKAADYVGEHRPVVVEEYPGQREQELGR